MTTISSKTILRSRNAAAPDHVLSTLLLRYPRWIHAEGRTHRLLDIGEDFQILIPTPSLMECDDLSRNASSSRAVPVRKLIEDVRSDPAIPLFWGKNIAGMQAREELEPRLAKKAEGHWLSAMEAAIRHAENLCDLNGDEFTAEGSPLIGTHKQIVNRLLEPFSHITVVVSATEWSNFLALRDHPDAEPHIAMLARAIRECLVNDPIQELQPGEWHTPFVPKSEWAGKGNPMTMGEIIGKSVACCASTSYKTVEGFDMTLERAVALHDKLVASTPLHASPCEHVAQADHYLGPVAYETINVPVPYIAGNHNNGYSTKETRRVKRPGEPRPDWDSEWLNPEEHGNFTGFRQYRKQLQGECL